MGDDHGAGQDQGAVAAADALIFHHGLQKLRHGGGRTDAAFPDQIIGHTLEGHFLDDAAPDDSYTANNKVYHVYLLTDAQMKAASDYVKATGQFYVPITFSQEGSTHTVYFNPNVAKSQVNGSYNHTFTDSNSDGSCNTCGNGKSHEYHLPTGKEMEIRSARQFAALSTMPNYISSDYYYVQKMHIDADQYQWTSSDDKKINSIGTAEQPFNTSYSGLYVDELTNEQKNYLLSGFQVVDAGIFGVIGETGSISNLTVVCTADMTAGSAEKENVAVLAGENRGSISFVNLTINGNASLRAKTNAGLLAGNSIGTVSDCAVTTAENKTVTLTAPNAGGMIGNAEGTITRCGVTMNGTLQIKEAVYAGCVLGHAVNTVCDQLIVSVKNLDASADIAAGLAGYAEGCTFSGSADASVTDVTVSGSLRSTGIASGVLGNAINTTLIGVDAGISEVSGSTAAGFLGVGDNVDATNCKVVITKSVTGTNGAAGVAGTIGSESVFNHVPVTLTGVTVSADGGNAAGYALEIKARAIVMGQSHVTLGGYQTSGNVLVPVNAAVIRGSQNAAGYAYTVAGSVGEAHVVGCGQIHGGNAAGFAVEVSGSISDAFVSPALTQDDAGYLGNSNANLSVTGTDSAAGFVLNVDKNGSVSTAYTLCAVSSSGTIEIEKEPEPTEETTEPSEATDPSEATTAPTEIQMESVVSAYGFAGTNSGTISRSAANVDLDSGFGFVGVNNGLITTCYGWYGDGKDDSATTARGKIAGTGNCYSTYIAQLENQARDQKSVMVYDDDGLASEVTPNKLQSLSFSGFTSGYDAHPYAPMNPEDYLYPMLRDHFGSWIIPPQYSTGVAYYERYEDGSIKTHMYDLSDSSLTMEQADITTTQVIFDNALAITETGYAMFYNAASGEGDGEPILTKIVGAYTYNFFPIDGTDVVEIPKPMGQAKYAYIDTRFADAVKVNAEFGDNETYQLRTPEQLTNVGQLPNAAFNQTHDIAIADGSFPAIATFGGSYNGGSLMITVGTGAEWMTETTGTVQNVNLKVNGTITEPIFGNVTGTLDTVAVTCSSTASSLIDSVSGTDTADASLTNVDLTITGEVTAFAGSGLLVNSLGSYSGITNCDVNAGSVVLNASDIPVYTVGTTDSNTFGGITGVVPTGVTLTGNTVTASLSVQGADQTLTVIGGLVGINGGAVSGGSTNVSITYKQTALSDTDDQTGIGGLVGWMLPGSSLANTSSSGAISLSEGGSGANRDWYFIGGAVGFDGGATYNGVSTTSKIDEKWAGATLFGEIKAYVSETPEQAAAAVCPAGFGPVGKFVGYVSSNSNYQNCSAIGSGTTKAYQFLGEVASSESELSEASLIRTPDNSPASFPEDCPDTKYAPGVSATWTDWYEGEYVAGTKYRVFNVTLTNCTFELGTVGPVKQTVNTANYNFYKHNGATDDVLSVYSVGDKVSTLGSPVAKQFKYENIFADVNSVNGYYFFSNDSYYRATATATTESNKDRKVTLYNGDTSISAIGDYHWLFAEWWTWSPETVNLYSMTESTNTDTSYVLANYDKTLLYTVADGVASAVSDMVFRSSVNANSGAIWTYSNGTFTLVNSTISKPATNDLSASIHDDNYLKYTIDGSDYYLYNYTESSHGYRATFIPANVSNLICSYTK